VKRIYKLVWWPDQGYFNLTWPRFLTTLFDSAKMNRIFEIIFYRRYYDDADPNKLRDLAQWPNRHEFEMYVRRDLASEIWDLNVTPVTQPQDSLGALLAAREMDMTAIGQYAGVYDEKPLLQPRTLAVAPDGRRVIADTGNNRIVVLAPDGTLVQTFGSECRLNEGAAGGCVDPDGSGPRALGDGQFYEPWGVAVDDEGRIYVADTWNGRIQVFDANGEFLRSWGFFGSTNGELGDPYALFGPRGLAIDNAGNLLVADTGNKRIITFTPDGTLVNQVGGGGVILGRFEEPVGIAVDAADGSIYVADAWNQRIQKLDAALQPLAEWPVPGWESREIFHKPYLAVAANGDVYASDPQQYRIMVYDRNGQLKAAFGDFGPEMNRFGLPVGVAYDPANNQVLVADSDNNRVMVFPAVP
jgi:DNA-binding beta-propeller fold protein YncE